MRPPPHAISARIRNMEMAARALRQDSGRALKISAAAAALQAPESAKVKLSSGSSVKRVVWGMGGQGASGKGVCVSRKHLISAAS